MDQRGFTLVELLVMMVTVVVILLGVFTLLDGGTATFLRSVDLIEGQQDARVALDRALMEIRNSGYNPARIPGEAGFSALSGTSPTGFTLHQDLSVPPNKTDTDAGERVTYEYRNEVLWRQAIGLDPAPVPLAGNVVRFNVTYGVVRHLFYDLTTVSIEIHVRGEGAVVAMLGSSTTRNP